MTEPLASDTAKEETGPQPRIGRFERVLLWVIFAGIFVLRVLYAAHFRIDSDEPQHLHVVWGWANGLLPYRDLFDNHMPLFQALCAPFFKAFGIRPDIIVPMRILMNVPFAITLVCVARIGTALFSPRAGAWAAAVAACCPPFFLTSLEFRPDNLWTMFWLVSLMIFTGGPLRPRRAFLGGLALGFAFSVSMKSTLMLFSIVVAGLVVAIVHRFTRPPAERQPLFACVGAAIGGLLIPPVAAVLFFVASGAGPAMAYCVIKHNIVPRDGAEHDLLTRLHKWVRFLVFPVAGALLIAVARLVPARRNGTLFVFLAAILFWITLQCFWPIITAEDFLPIPPALIPAIIAVAFAACARWLPALPWLAPTLALTAVAGELAQDIRTDSPFENQTTDKIGMVADILRLTSPDDYVNDSKGETIYRKRPFFYVLEGLTHKRLRAGLIKDDIAERLIATRTPVTTLRRMPLTAAPFLASEYIPIAFRLSVLGKFLYQPAGASGPRPATLSFDVQVPNRYTIVAEHGTIAGTLNGEPFTGPRELAPGHYEFKPTGGEGRLALIWAPAIERGYSPFAPIKPDYKSPQD